MDSREGQGRRSNVVPACDARRDTVTDFFEAVLSGDRHRVDTVTTSSLRQLVKDCMLHAGNAEYDMWGHVMDTRCCGSEHGCTHFTNGGQLCGTHVCYSDNEVGPEYRENYYRVLEIACEFTDAEVGQVATMLGLEPFKRHANSSTLSPPEFCW